jgi:hypothetical protein
LKRLSVIKMTTRLNNEEERQEWHEKSDHRFWINGSYQHYDPSHRTWVITTLTNDLAMVDSELVIDPDGDRVHRTVFMINKDGTPCLDHGFLRCFDTHYLRAQHIKPVSDAYQKKLDDWVKGMTECVMKEGEPMAALGGHGMRYETVEYKPCRMRIPGWDKVSKKELEKRQKQNIKAMTRMFMGGGF